MLRQKQTELDEWRNKYFQLDSQLSELRKLEYLLKESENRIKNFESEIVRLNDTLRKKLEELEFWKNKYQNYEFESN